MALLPPNHSPTGKMKYIHSSDTALDSERFEKEIAEMLEKGEDPDTHPVKYYYSGQERYSLDRAKEYFDLTHATIFHIRLLTSDELAKVQDLTFNDKFHESLLLAFKLGVMEIENFEFSNQLKGFKTKAMRLTDLDIETIKKHVGLQVITDVGAAVIIANSDLKKK